jgi:hypothetical protein
MSSKQTARNVPKAIREKRMMILISMTVVSPVLIVPWEASMKNMPERRTQICRMLHLFESMSYTGKIGDTYIAEVILETVPSRRGCKSDSNSIVEMNRIRTRNVLSCAL